jgi:hypothetical protein
MAVKNAISLKLTVSLLAKQIDEHLKPGHAIRIKEFEQPFRDAIITTLIKQYRYNQEIQFHLRKPITF